MATFRGITQDIEKLRDIHTLVETYEEIAALYMRKSRDSVLHNRALHDALNSVFREVSRAYAKEVRELRKRKVSGSEAISRGKRNGKTALVFLSANSGLYGDIVQRVFALFWGHYAKGEGDPVVVGSVGRTLFEDALHSRPRQGESSAAPAYFFLSDDAPRVEDLADITKFLSTYERVLIFHGKLKTFISQMPAFTPIAGDRDPELSETPKEEISYLFEPSLEEVLLFFETEIFASLFEQMLHESRLAKLSSRMVLLDQAITNVDKETKNLLFARQKIRHSVLNKKQFDAVSGIIALARR